MQSRSSAAGPSGLLSVLIAYPSEGCSSMFQPDHIAKAPFIGVISRLLGRVIAPIVQEAQIKIRRDRERRTKSLSRSIAERRIELQRSYYGPCMD